MENEEVPSQPLISEIEVTYKHPVKPSKLPKINGAKDAYQLLFLTWDQSKIEYVEQFKMILLNRANRVLGICTISTGSSTGTMADPKQIFSIALKANASYLILAHNHPSGNLLPSKRDEEITQQMKSGGLLLDLKVLDHIIVTSEGYYSFGEEGVL